MSFCIIHLSDIHIQDKNDIILTRTDEICRACASVTQNNSTVVIAISGDIAFSGLCSQYELANGIIAKISEYLKNEKQAQVYTVFVPGNHDCDFKNENSVRKTLIEHIRPDIDEEYYKTVVSVQKNYSNFAADFDIDTNRALSKKEIIVNRNKFLFLLSNTAWMSVLKENPGKIIMPKEIFHDVDTNEYKVIFYLMHHPTNWLNPDHKTTFVEHIRKNADIVLIGHEHARDSYHQVGDKFSVFCSHGKELQDNYSHASAFSVMAFDDAFQTYTVFDFEWSEDKYNRVSEKVNQFHKNIAAQHSITIPNEETLKQITDLGINVNHFAKDDVLLPEIFVWPYLKKLNYNDEKKRATQIQSDIPKELYSNKISIVTGSSSSGKTSLAKMIYFDTASDDKSCLLIDGREFTSSNVDNISSIIEHHFIEQYSADCLEDFRQLPKHKKVIIIDNFDSIKTNKNRRNIIIDYLADNFDNVVLFMTSSIDITSIITSKSLSTLSDLFYYDILPLGNKKRKELISKWYYLGAESLTEEQIEERIESSISQLDTLLGNGVSFVPALPIFIIGILQNSDAIKPSYGNSKYAVLYESLILSTLSKISADYVSSRENNIDINIMSQLAFQMLTKKHTSFTESELIETVRAFENKKLFPVSHHDVLRKMTFAQIIFHDTTEGEVYRFKYPYIFYYFAGRYIARNLSDPIVKDMLEYMSSKLYNETYGNIIVFVCHFSNSKDVIDNILFNAYSTLEKYTPFDFTKSNPIFDEIHDAVEALIPESVGDNASVTENKNKVLERKDDIGINDGQVHNVESEIDDEVSEKEREQEIASVSAAFKTLEVLGQILQNYPGDIDGEDKIAIIDEMHKLGMRSVQAIINTMGYLEQDLVEYIIERAKAQNRSFRREEIVKVTKRFINYLISGTVRGMVHQVAISLNSIYILPAAKSVFEDDLSISSKLILMDLKLNCLNKPDYNEIAALKRGFDKANERFASSILSSIVGYYLNYNKCDRTLRSKLCSLCEIQERQVLIENKRKQLN